MVVTQSMIDHGFYVTAIYDSGLTFYHDSSLTQLADDPSFGNINLGIGDSTTPVMFTVAGGIVGIRAMALREIMIMVL